MDHPSDIRARAGARTAKAGPSARPSMAQLERAGSLFGDDLEAQHRIDVGEQMDANLVRAEGANGLVQVDILAVNRDARLRRDGVGDVRPRDRSNNLPSSPARAAIRICDAMSFEASASDSTFSLD